MLPDAATWESPDLELLRGGLIEADRLHPLASALAPGHPAAPVPRLTDRGGTAVPRALPGPTFVRASPRRCGPGPARTSSWR
ncbi:hypothetical protein ABT346_22710 [Micromonospora peucetia]|uniref:hypothetical protein n=1 Tax=Micromonospora peucetia TaxID=47871 RepID=UPI003332288A